MSEPNTPEDFITAIRDAGEDSALRSRIEVKRWLTVLETIFPAALSAAAAGNVTMSDAVKKIWPLLPKSHNPGSR